MYVEGRRKDFDASFPFPRTDSLVPLMSSPSAEDVINAFVRIVRDRLERGERVDVPELGTFDVEHRPSQVKEDNAGDRYMAPPRNVVTFEPEQ